MIRVAALAACLLLVAGCGADESVLVGRESLTLAVAGPFEPGLPAQAQAVLRGVEMAIAEYNEDRLNRRYEVKLMRADTKGTPEGAAQAAQAAASAEGIIGVIGPFSAEEAVAMGPVLSASQVPMLLPTVTETSLSEQGWSSFRRLVANDHAEGAALGLEVVRRAETGSVFMYHDGSGRSTAFIRGVQQTLERLQVPIARSEQAPPPGTIPEHLSGAAPSAVVLAGGAEQAGALIAALRGAGFKGSILISSDARTQDLAKQEVVEGTVSNCVCADRADPQLSGFVERFRERFSASPHAYSAEGYEAGVMVLEAIREVQPRPKDITEFFKTSTQFLGITKSYEFDPTGEPISPPVWLYRADERWRYQGRTEGAARPAGIERR